MTSKTFDNYENTRKLHIESTSRGFVLLKIEFAGYEKYFTVPNDIVPSISLALLESAGWPEREPTSVTHTILSDLSRVVEIQERAKAEAEDKAKLKAEALELVNAWREAGNCTPLTDWGTLIGTSVGDYWLAVARKAREIGGRAEK